MADPQRKLVLSRLKLVILALCFLGPLVIAWLWYANVDDWRPAGAGSGSHGDLFQPARPLENVVLTDAYGQALDGSLFQGHWTLVYIGSRQCDELCRDRLYFTRQIRTAMGREIHRVQRLYLLPEWPSGEALEARLEGHPDITAAVPQARRDWLEQFRHENGEHPVGANRIYIVDPLGNIVMSFSPEVDPRDIRDDLNHLLRVSRIG